MFALREGSVRTRSYGRGDPTVMFLHGFGGTLDQWDAVAREATCARSVLVDLPGFGGSFRDSRDYTLGSQARRLVELMDGMGIDSVVLVGTSMGSSVAIQMAATVPERVQGVVVGAPSGYPGSLTYAGLRGFLQGTPIGAWLSRRALANPVFAALFPNSLARQALSVVGSYGEGFEGMLTRVDRPLLLLWSRGDRTVPFEFSTEYLRLVPGSRLVELPEAAGHGIATFEPDARADDLCTFIRSLD